MKVRCVPLVKFTTRKPLNYTRHCVPLEKFKWLETFYVIPAGTTQQAVYYLRELKFKNTDPVVVPASSKLFEAGVHIGRFRQFSFFIKVIQSNLVIRNFMVTLKLFLNAKCSLPLWSKLATGYGFLTTICSLSDHSLSPSLTILSQNNVGDCANFCGLLRKANF